MANEQNNFEKMLEESFSSRKSIEPGAFTAGRVTDIKSGFLFIRTEDGMTGIVPQEEFSGELPALKDELRVWFLREVHGDYYFTTCLNGDNINAGTLELAWKNSIPVMGHFTGKIKGGRSV